MMTMHSVTWDKRLKPFLRVSLAPTTDSAAQFDFYPLD